MLSSRIVIELCRLRASHWRVLGRYSSAKEVCAPPSAGDSHDSALISIQFTSTHQCREGTLQEADTPQEKIKNEVKSDCFFKSLAVWGQGRKRQRGRLDEDT